MKCHLGVDCLAFCTVVLLLLITNEGLINSYQHWGSLTIVLVFHIQTLDVPQALTHGSFFFKAVCVPNCQNGGLCVKPDQCACQSGWVGSRCSRGKPYPSEYRDSSHSVTH